MGSAILLMTVPWVSASNFGVSGLQLARRVARFIARRQPLLQLCNPTLYIFRSCLKYLQKQLKQKLQPTINNQIITRIAHRASSIRKYQTVLGFLVSYMYRTECPWFRSWLHNQVAFLFEAPWSTSWWMATSLLRLDAEPYFKHFYRLSNLGRNHCNNLFRIKRLVWRGSTIS